MNSRISLFPLLALLLILVPNAGVASDLVNFTFFEALSLPTEKPSKTVLVLCLDISKPGLPLEQAQWKDFAEKNNLGVLSIGLKPRPGLQDRQAAGVELASLIDAAIEEKFGGAPDRIGYGQVWGAEWLLRAVHAAPRNWKFVGTRGAKVYPPIRNDFRELSFPPAVIMNDEPELFKESREYFMNLRRLNPESQRAAFVGSSSAHLDSLYLNRFFQQYIGAILSRRIEGPGYWLSIHGNEGVPAEGKTQWTHHSWVPNAELAGAWRMLNREADPPPPPRQEEWPFETEAGTQKLQIRIPGALVANESLPANGVVIWMTQTREGEELSKIVMNQNDDLIRYSELNSMPIVAWDAVGIWPEDGLQVAAEMEPAAVATADQAFIRVGDAMVGEIRKIGRELGWPEDKWLLTADTSAARYGLMLAQGYPFLAVHLHSATGYEEMVMEPAAPWLVTSGWGDGGAQETLRFANQARAEPLPVLYKRFASLGHRTRWDQRMLTTEFFDFVLEMKRDGEELFPWSRDWSKPPFPEEYLPRTEVGADGNEITVRPEFPEGFKPVDYAPPRPYPQSVGEWFSEALRRSQSIGDWRRGEVWDRADEGVIPPWWRVRIPSWELAEIWSFNQGEFPELSETDQEGLAKYLEKLSTQPQSAEPKEESSVGETDGNGAESKTTEE